MSHDMPAAEFVAHAQALVERIADMLEHPESRRVVSRAEPGEVRAALAGSPPADGRAMTDVIAEAERVIVPGLTQWNHPGFLAYFPNTGSYPAVLAELLATSLNVNAMLWRTSPAATELEAAATDWLRQMLGLPTPLFAEITDTASTSTLYALAAARETALPGSARTGIGGAESRSLIVYCSEEAHSSVDKAAMTLGVGTAGVRRIATDDELRMRPDALARAIDEDRRAGKTPFAVVATVGTTSTTSIDPVPEIAQIAKREGIWLHVDAAYGGAAAVIPEMRHVLAGCEHADSLVVNPHKWLFVPMDCSVLFTRRPEALRAAFSLVPEFVLSDGYLSDGYDAVNLMDYGVALGRRFRSLKLWFVLSYFGSRGLADRLRAHVDLAKELERDIAATARFEVLAPVPFSTVVFRARGRDEADAERRNARIMSRVNDSGEVFISHTRVRGRYALRIAIGNIRTARSHVRRAWELIQLAEAEVKTIQELDGRR